MTYRIAGLQELADDLQNCEMRLKAAGRMTQLNNEDQLVKILVRCPKFVKPKLKKHTQTDLTLSNKKYFSSEVFLNKFCVIARKYQASAAKIGCVNINCQVSVISIVKPIGDDAH